MNRLLGTLFYRVSAILSEVEMIPSGPEFCLLSSAAVQAVRQYREAHRFLRGLVALLGFPSATLTFTPDPRQAGQTKYSIRKLIRLASDGLFSFSTTPLYFSIGLGAAFLLVAFVELAILVASFLLEGKSPTPGWTSLMVVTAGGFGTTMILLGIIGIYIGKVFEQVKHRPIYLVERSSASNTSLGNLSRNLNAHLSSFHKGDRESDSQLSLRV
jgi:dolichol-phosphate mannosyltransferase